MNAAVSLLAVLSVLCATLVACQEAEKTFGVKPTDQHLYDSKPFKCDDGSKILKQKQINDDYCDCTDGTDEPGTSACDNGKFWCENTGHVGQFIFSSRVNDGICDCCDGRIKNTRIKPARIIAGKLGRKLVDCRLKRKRRGESVLRKNRNLLNKRRLSCWKMLKS